MATAGDLRLAEDSLWGALSQDKRPLGLLLGAGCGVSVRSPVEDRPLIPDIAGMTRDVVASLGQTEGAASLESLIAGLEEDLGCKPNVEDMLTRLRTLRSVAGTDVVRGLSVSDIDSLEGGIVKEIAGIVSAELPEPPSPFDDLARWAGGARRVHPVEIFTTNYDLLIEQALEQAQVPFFDGFVGGVEPFMDLQTIEEGDLPSRWVRLWKLHGSIHWTQRDRGIVRLHSDDDASRPMIHPSHLKYDQSRRMPYLVMQDRLRAFLKQPSATLVTVGYSFGDEHINALLAQGVETNPTSIIFGLLFRPSGDHEAAMKLGQLHPNVQVIARDGGTAAGRVVTWNSGVESQNGDFLAFGESLRGLRGAGERDESGTD